MMTVNTEKCIGCGQCVKDCFARDIEMCNGKANIKNQTCIKCGHCIAVCPKAAVSTDEYDMAEVKEYNSEEFDITPENLLNFIKFRRSTRQFSSMDIEKDKLSKIIEAGRFTQTGINLQDASFIVIKDNINELKELALESLKNTGETILANLTPQNMMYKRYSELWVNMYNQYKQNPSNDSLFFNAPAVIIVTANSDVNATLAASNMELMTNTLGLGTFFSGFFIKAAEGNKKIMDFLGVKEGKHIVNCMVVGYPKVKYLRTVPRRTADISWK